VRACARARVCVVAAATNVESRVFGSVRFELAKKSRAGVGSRLRSPSPVWSAERIATEGVVREQCRGSRSAADAAK
jgi:hypothetical protein